MAQPAATLGRPPGRRGEETAERILDAAEALFAEKGFDGTTLRDVASAVGIRNPSLYNHFESKEALYQAVLGRGIGPLVRMVHDLATQPVGEVSVPELIETTMATLAARPGLARLVQHETLRGGHRPSGALRDFLAPVLEDSFAAASRRAEGRWSPEHVPLLVLAIYNTLVGYFTIAPLYREVSGQDLLSPDALADHTRFLVQLVETLLPEPDPTHS